jgi:hypothetical protein
MGGDQVKLVTEIPPLGAASLMDTAPPTGLELFTRRLEMSGRFPHVAVLLAEGLGLAEAIVEGRSSPTTRPRASCGRSARSCHCATSSASTRPSSTRP